MAGNRIHNVPLGSVGSPPSSNAVKKAASCIVNLFLGIKLSHSVDQDFLATVPFKQKCITADSTGLDKEYRAAVITHI